MSLGINFIYLIMREIIYLVMRKNGGLEVEGKESEGMYQILVLRIQVVDPRKQLLVN